jgi:hypothetical protein
MSVTLDSLSNVKSSGTDSEKVSSMTAVLLSPISISVPIVAGSMITITNLQLYPEQKLTVDYTNALGKKVTLLLPLDIGSESD